MSSEGRVSASHIFERSVANGNYIYQLSTLTIIGKQMTASAGFKQYVICSGDENEDWCTFQSHSAEWDRQCYREGWWNLSFNALAGK
jgi:hypothetical protein